MAKIFFNTLYYLTIGAVGLLGLLLVSTLIPIPGNFQAKVVKSGSMEPVLPVGSVVIIRPEKTYNVGDIVTFGADTKTQIPTTHRIVSKVGEGAQATFSTKGDANDTPDQNTVRMSDIHGKLVFDLPYVGYVLAFARTKLGFFLLVGVPALFVFFEEGKNIFLEIKRLRTRRRKGRAPVAAMEYEVPEAENASVAAASRPSMDGVRRMGRVIAVVLGVGLLGGLVATMGSEGDTVAYYADTTTSLANKLGASDDFTQPLVVELSEPQLVSISANTLQGEDVQTEDAALPPPEELTNPWVQPPSTESVQDAPPQDILPEQPLDANQTIMPPAETPGEQTPPIEVPPTTPMPQEPTPPVAQ